MSPETIKTKKTLKEEKKEPIKDFGIDIDEMTKAGIHLGHKISKLHPNMEEYIVGIRNTVHIINLKKTASGLKEALVFISELLKKEGKMLLIGTKVPLKSLIEDIAKESNLFYVSERWLGGTFTNFKVINKRVQYFKELENKKKEGKLEKYTKKERIEIEKELNKLEKKFKGIKNMETLPDAVFICDIVKDNLALKEAKAKKIKVIAIVDTNADPLLVDYPIPANDDAISSVKYILEKVVKIVKKSKK